MCVYSLSVLRFRFGVAVLRQQCDRVVAALFDNLLIWVTQMKAQRIFLSAVFSSRVSNTNLLAIAIVPTANTVSGRTLNINYDQYTRRFV